MTGRIFTLNSSAKMPGHKEGDILFQNSKGNYEWEVTPFYEMAAAQVEEFEEFFIEHKHSFVINEDIYFVDSNGRIYKVPFSAEQHCSLVVYGNIFKFSNEAIELKKKLDRIIKTGTDNIVDIPELNLLRSLLVNGNVEKSILFIDKIIEEINLQNGTN